MTLIIVVNVLLGAGGYLRAAMRRDLPLTGWLDRLPPPPTWATVLNTLTIPLRMRRSPGQHTADALTVRLAIGGQRADGTYVHGGTGPMPVLWDDATPFGRAQRPGGAR